MSNLENARQKDALRDVPSNFALAFSLQSTSPHLQIPRRLFFSSVRLPGLRQKKIHWGRRSARLKFRKNHITSTPAPGRGLLLPREEGLVKVLDVEREGWAGIGEHKVLELR